MPSQTFKQSSIKTAITYLPRRSVANAAHIFISFTGNKCACLAVYSACTAFLVLNHSALVFTEQENDPAAVTNFRLKLGRRSKNGA